MPLLESLIGPIASIIDKVIPDKEARAKAKLELLALEGTQELRQIEARLSAIVAEAQSSDPWTSRARPSFLYVMYALILFAVPMGLIAAFDPTTARAIGEGMTAYLAALPEPLYALFGRDHAFGLDKEGIPSLELSVDGQIANLRLPAPKQLVEGRFLYPPRVYALRARKDGLVDRRLDYEFGAEKNLALSILEN